MAQIRRRRASARSPAPPRPVTQAAASQRVRDEWLRRVEAEYRSAVITQHLTLWLMQAGASPDLLEDGLRIAGDELAHAELSLATYAAADGTDAPRLVRETLGLPRTVGEPLEHDIARACVDVFCLGETIAVPLFKELREPCAVAPARRALDRILRDEVRHRDFGWALLDWLLDAATCPLAPALRALVERELPRFVARVRASYGADAARGHTTIDPNDRAWGLMAPARYAEVFDRAIDRDWIPRFERVGIDARAAFDRSENPAQPTLTSV